MACDVTVTKCPTTLQGGGIGAGFSKPKNKIKLYRGEGFQAKPFHTEGMDTYWNKYLRYYLRGKEKMVFGHISILQGCLESLAVYIFKN